MPCAAFVSTRTSQCSFSLTHSRTWLRQFSSAPYQIKFNPTVLVGLNFMGRATRLYIPIRLWRNGPLSKSQRFELRFARSHLLFCRTSSSNPRHSVSIKLKKPSCDGFLNLMGRATRFELATFGTTNRRSNQLSYARHKLFFCTMVLVLFCPPSLKLRRDTEFS